MPYSRIKSKSKKPDFTKERGFRGGGTVTAIEVQKTNTERVNVFIDEQYAFSLALIVAESNRLRPGRELSPAEVGELQAEDLYSLALSGALELIALRPRSEAEVRTRLKRRFPDAPFETINRVLDRLKELNYLNDADFAKFWIENRQAFAPRGRQLLKQELMQKGVNKDIIEEAITNYLDAANEELAAEAGEGDGAEESPTNIEEAQALELARKKGRSYIAEDWAGFYRKLGSFLLRRGYDYGIAGRVVKQVWKEQKGQTPEGDFD